MRVGLVDTRIRVEVTYDDFRAVIVNAIHWTRYKISVSQERGMRWLIDDTKKDGWLFAGGNLTDEVFRQALSKCPLFCGVKKSSFEERMMNKKCDATFGAFAILPQYLVSL